MKLKKHHTTARGCRQGRLQPRHRHPGRPFGPHPAFTTESVCADDDTQLGAAADVTDGPGRRACRSRSTSRSLRIVVLDDDGMVQQAVQKGESLPKMLPKFNGAPVPDSG